MITQTYTLSLQPGGVPLRVPCVQGDTGARDLVFTLTSNGTAANLPAGAGVTLDGTKPDGKSFTSWASLDGDTVTTMLTQQMCAVAGEVSCQLTITSGNEILCTPQFLLEVAPSALPASPDLSDSDISLLTQIKNTVNQLSASISTGSWTPTLSGMSAYSYQKGRYVKIGDVAIVSFTLWGIMAGDNTEQIKITGCPFTPANGGYAGGGSLSGYYVSDDIVFSGWTVSTDGGIYAYGQVTGTGNKWEQNGIYQKTDGECGGGGTIMFQVS